ncbi:MAG TPA: DUF2341 domain-containing protein, partial [Candidatus Thermoplasmatota archaeon]|nr:DUF2341 domain-containing protein [Candidatus Thermoplasmatota archaeon]
MNHKMSIYKKAVGFAIVALFIAGAFVPANGFILRDTTVSTKPSPPTLQKDINPILILDTFEQTQNNIDISDGLEQKQKGPPQPLNPLDPWWNPSFSYRKEITIDHTKITANLTNFPVLISLSSDVDLAAHTQSDGDDIVFINNATGTKLNHEIEMYNSTGRLVAWINVTNLSKTADTKLYMYYGNSSCGSQQNPKGVWDSNYVSVWHLNEDPGVAGNGGIKDSTRYYNNGTDMGTMNAADHVTGKIGYGIDFDGTDDVIRIDNSNVVGHCLDFTSGPFTIEAWFTARTRTGTIICKRDGVPSNADQYQMYLDPVTNGIYFRAGLEYGYGSDTLSTNTWYYGAAVVDSNEWPNITRDGVLRTWSNTPGAGSPPYVFTHRNVNVSIGARWNTYPATGYLLPGIIDEIRISKINRSSSWLSTSYNNQNNPIGFSTLGSEETLGGNQAPVITSSTPVDGTSFVKLNPTLAITINDPDGDTMNISFKTNATGSWSVIGSNLSIGNGTYQQTPTTMNSYHTKYYWSVNVNDGPKWTNKTYWFKTEPEPGIWWDTNWMYRKRIEISHTQIASNLTNFPVLITFPSDADLATDAQDDGDDLVFTDFNGNQLHHENELFDGVTGKLIIWVNVTSLSHLNDTVVYLYYGNALCDNQQNINGVWKSDYVAVWHLNQDPGVVGTSGILDSTNYSNDGTDMGSMDAADHVIGKIGYGVDFDGTDDVIKIENSWTAGHILDFTNESSFTLEAWFNCRTTTNQGTLINKRDSPTASIHYDQYQFHLQPNPQFRANQEFGGGTDTLGTSTWYYGAAVVTSNGTIGGWPIIYRDGILKTWADNTGTRPYSIIHRNVNVSIGARWAGYPTAGYLFSGVIDEVRISKTNRNSSWLLTCYNNQNNPGGFYIVTPKETGTRPEVPQVTDEVPNNSTTGTILNPLLTVNVIDYQGNTMNVWFKTNASGTWTVIGSNTSVGNGTYRQIPTAMISYNTKYYWSVNVFDGTYWMNKTFWFMTKINYPPVMTNLNPTNGSIGNLISLAQLSITLNDPEGNPITYSITTSPNIGSKSETGINNGTITVDVSGLAYNTTYSWSVKATDSAGSGQWTNNTYWFKTERGPGTWWNTNWAYRKEITIDHTKVATNLTNFPVLIKLSSDADLATDAQDDGDDLVFTEYNTGILNHEIELFNGTTGQLVAWVNSSSLSRTADTILYLYYGNGVVGNQQNPEGVWDIHYKGVWHFNNSILDSTTNNDDGTNYGSTNAIGTIGGSRYFDGNDYITAPQHCIGANQNWTASCWFRSNSTSSMVYHYFFSTGPYTGPTSYGAFQLYHNMNDATYLPIDEVRTRLQDQDSDFSQLYQYGGSAAEDTWHLVHVTWNALTHNFRIYVNGSLVNQSTNAAVTGAGTTLPLYIGARGDLDTQRYHIGSIDEARIISQTKTAGWITTEYNNQYNPSGFSTLGDEEEAPLVNQPPIFSSENPTDNTGILDINIPSVSVLIQDPEGDAFDWTIEGQYVTSAGANGAVNGTKSASLITPLPYITNIIWYVNATDGFEWTREVYNFTTRAQYIPGIPSGFTATAMNRTRIDLSWTKGDKTDKTCIERNLVASWNRGEGTLIYNNTGTNYQDTGLSQNIHYYYQALSWNTTDHVYSTTSAAADATTFANQLPVFSGENPADNTGNIGINTPSVNVLILDPDGDVFDWMIQGQYVTNAGANDASNGTKSASLITPLPFSTNVIWYVNATDGVGWARMVYNFTTRSQYIPSIPSEFTATAMSRTRIDLAW